MISFMITVLNRPDNLIKFFQTMPHQSQRHEWIIIDNGSEDFTKQVEYWLQGQFPNVKLIENDENRGFGPANNQGAELAQGNILVFTQPDVEFHGDVTKYLEPDVLFTDYLYGHQLLNYDTGWNRFGERVISYLTGYFLACDAPTWARLGGFDPTYWPADFEDVDLSYTAVQKGIRLQTLDVPISHAHFGSTWSQFPNREEVTRRNRKLFAQKWSLYEPSAGSVRDPEHH